MTKKRERRQFDAAFKVEAVRRMQERLAVQGSLADIARDLQVRPEQLRGWSRLLAKGIGQAPREVFPEAEYRARKKKCNSSGASWRR